MDYYSGSPEPNDYNNDGYNGYNGQDNFNLSTFFKKNGVFVLMGLGAFIILLIVLFVLFGGGSGKDIAQKDYDSDLKSLEVYGGTLTESFSKDVKRYTIEANSRNITFSCEASSKKAKIKGCDEGVTLSDEDEEVEHVITVTAEDTSVTRYRLKIIKASDYAE